MRKALMRASSITTLAISLFSAVARASISNPFNVPATGYSITAGQTTSLHWEPTSPGTVTLVLRSGNADDLAQGTVIACPPPPRSSSFHD